MHYFIDGYNLMFRFLRAGDDLQKQREAIIRDLNSKIKVVDINVTVVFDAQYQANESPRSHFQHLEILFSKQGQTADECILLQLKHEENPRQQTVVTSDKKLAWQVRRLGANTETVEDFLKQLNNRYKNKIRRSKIEPVPIISKIHKKALPIPLKKSTPEESFDYYLEKFETSYQKLIEAQPEKKREEIQKKKKVPKLKKDKKEEGVTDFERWLKAFERDSDD